MKMPFLRGYHASGRLLHLKYIALLAGICTSLYSCMGKQGIYDDVQRELKRHHQPSDSALNVIPQGKTIVLWHSETKGIDRSKYPLPHYRKEIDTAFLQFVEEKEFNDPEEAGGSAFYLEIYKAVRKGETEIKVYKSLPLTDTADSADTPHDSLFLNNLYKFRVE